MAARPQPEARSLSAINYLASNPPQYPYHPEPKESLTLYVSRVPGTQDIILSTFRPQKKNVTGEDVTNSLYYIHLNSPQDGLLAAPQGPENAVSPRSSSESVRSAIPRKPLPVSAKVPGLEPAAVTGGVPSAPAAYLGPTFKPHASVKTESATTYAAVEPRPAEAIVEGYRENPMFRKRQSGPPADASGIMPRTAVIHATPLASPIPRKALALGPPGALLTPGIDAYVPVASGAQHRPVTPTQFAPQPAYSASQGVPITSPPSHSHPDKTASLGRVGHRPSSLSFSLTIIRRDPASGTQSNVGTVSSFQTNVPTPETAGPHLDPDNMGVPQTQKIDICLETSGYVKYRDMPSRASVDAYRPTSGHSYTQQVLREVGAGTGADRATTLKPAAHGLVEEGFSRQVVMSYGPSWKSNFKKAFQRRDGPGSVGSTSPEGSAPPRYSHARHGSASTVGSVDSADGRHSPTLFTQPGPGLKPRGYVFLSPWDGRCEFRTDPNGRSLKCRHILDPANMKLDPREVAQNMRDAQAMGRSRGDEFSSALVGARPVSELRFNLPNGAHHRKLSDRDGGAKAGRWDPSHLSGQFSKLLHHRSRTSEEDSDNDEDDNDYENDTPMDLSLGKEHAGGGSKGRRAKLGKLIIHDEGLKMLDLVVAANIGVWWTTWGRTI